MAEPAYTAAAAKERHLSRLTEFATRLKAGEDLGIMDLPTSVISDIDAIRIHPMVMAAALPDSRFMREAKQSGDAR